MSRHLERHIWGIQRMNQLSSWAQKVLDHPEFLTIPYYEKVGETLREKGEELIKEERTANRKAKIRARERLRKLR